MARPRRLCVPGYPLHIVQRGHDRAPCFFTDAERTLYLGLLATFSRRVDCLIHGYVLMTNHVHLLLTPRSICGPSQLMKDVGQRFAQYMNRKYSRVGSFWQGRFHSSLVDTDSYFLACQRYIEANPVRAGMVSHATHYSWSSFAHNGCGVPSTLLTPHPTYLSLGSDGDRRLAAYRSLCGVELDPQVVQSIRDALKGGFPFGSDRFVDEMALRTGARMARGRPGPRPKLARPQQLFRRARSGSDPELL